MQFLNVKLQNYKGISEVEIDLSDTQLVCLLGMNEAGKTTILEGLHYLGFLCHGGVIRNGLRQKMKPATDPFNGTITLEATVLFENEEEIEAIRPKEDSSDEEVSIVQSIRKKLSARRIQTVSLKFAFPYIDGVPKPMERSIKMYRDPKDVLRTEPVLDAIDKFAPEIILYKDILFSAPDAVIFASENLRQSEPDAVAQSSKLRNEKNQKWQHIFSDILTSEYGQKQDGKNWDFQQDYIDALATEQLDASTADRRLAGMNRCLNQTITKEWTDVNGKQTFDRIAIEHLPKIEPEIGVCDYALQLKVYSNGVPFPLKERSKGAQWYFCFKILTHIRASRLKNGAIFLLDEPAANLHPSNQHKLFQSLVGSAIGEKTKVIYATHSAEMTGSERKQLEHTYLVVNSIDESKDASSSGKIEAKSLTKIKKSHLERNGLYAQAISPLVNNLVVQDAVGSSRKQGGMAILENVKANPSVFLQSINLLLRLIGM